MAKQPKSGVLNRLAGKKLVFSGKFSYGIEDALKAMAQAQQGKVLDDLDASVDYLVLADAHAGKTIQKKAVSLNAKGAAIQVIDADAFRKLAEPTDAEMLELLRTGQSETYAKLRVPQVAHSVKCAYHAEVLKGAKLTQVHFHDVHFDGCDFTGATLTRAFFTSATNCNFSNITGDVTRFDDVQHSKFRQATLMNSSFDGDLSEADFTGATLQNVSFRASGVSRRGMKSPIVGISFEKAKLESVSFHELHLKSPSFANANLTGVFFRQCRLESANLRGAILREAAIVGCNLAGADLSNADLTLANFADTDLTGAKLAGANLQNANLRGAKLEGVDFSKAKNFDASSTAVVSAGPALKELDNVNSKAQRIHVKFLLNSTRDGEHPAELDSAGLRYGWGLISPGGQRHTWHAGTPVAFSDALRELANVAGHRQVRFETVEVSSTKSPTGGKELRELVIRAIAEAFAQAPPSDEELAAATKQFREAERAKGAVQRKAREQAKVKAQEQKEKAQKQLIKQIEKTVGKVSDTASFLKALELRIEKPKIDKATKMLKASGFKLFNDITEEHVSGVVKSQSDPDLVYACRLAHDGQYACCTQNLNICGGLRGSICKHLLVLIIGLVQADELDPTTIDAWIAKTHAVKPELDKENMGAIFIKYKGAEAGEVDWRPTETVPEDYYAL